MTGDGTKHVQTELTDEEYRSFRQFAGERGLTVKEAAREALRQWIDRQQRADPRDPAFTVLDELDAESLPPAAATDARTEDDVVTEWAGDDAFELADEPASAR
ncbi:MAG: hypothetical protein ABEJ92_06260 [Halobacteriales archaeon]